MARACRYNTIAANDFYWRTAPTIHDIDVTSLRSEECPKVLVWNIDQKNVLRAADISKTVRLTAKVGRKIDPKDGRSRIGYV
jgi:hypothetical protein